MEKDYTVRLYCFGKSPDGIYTKTQLLEVAGMITKITPFTDLDAAIEVLAKDFNIATYQVLERDISLSIDDFLGNIKPNGHFSTELDLGIFKNNVDKESYFINNFSKFSSDEKTVICEFIKKAINLYDGCDNYGSQLLAFLGSQMQTVISTFVRNLFQTDDPRNIHNQLLQMQKFNSIELEELKDILIDVIDKVSIKELATNKDRINLKLADDFYHQIVVANTKKV